MKLRWIAPLLLAIPLTFLDGAASGEGPFLVKPYLQLGTSGNPAALAVMWQAESNALTWSLEWKGESSNSFQQAGPIAVRTIALGKRHFVYVGNFTELKAGEKFEYRVLLDGKRVFESEGRARPASNENYKFAVFGDCGADSSGEKSVAFQVHKFKPDFAFIPGDIVYLTGLASEYHTKLFPVYNADHADRKSGVPLMRSTVFVAALGNHDIAGRDLKIHSDGLAYFYYWSFPLNGLAPFRLPGFKAGENQVAELAEASGGAFPRMSNYSFDYGNSHWLVLDSNPDVDWSRPEFSKWVAEDLNSPAARKAAWRFVGFHHPAFSSSHMHSGDQQMRVLSKIFEDAGVDVAFGGHVHNYQRSAPLHFKLSSFDAAKSHQAPGEWTIDHEFDGKTHTKPNGVIHIVSGAGGALLYDKGQSDERTSWKDFTVQFVSGVHSFTAVEMKGDTAKFRQIDEQGRVVDDFTVTKN